MTEAGAPTLLRRTEVEARLGVSRSWIYCWIYCEMRAGRFPEPVRIGRRAVRRRIADLDAWAAGRPLSHGDTGPRPDRPEHSGARV